MTMEHAEALELIEIAAAEPDGLERLTAGDTPEAAAVAGHLAGCPACVAELAQIRRTVAVAREVIQAEPDPALRERTLAFVRAVGRDRSAEAAAAAPASSSPAVLRPIPERTGDDRSSVASRSAETPASRVLPFRRAAGRPSRFAWVAGLAAVLVVASGVGFAAGTASRPGQVADGGQEVGVLSDATTVAMRIAAEPDARHVTLTSTTQGAATGSLVFSPGTGELVMIATDLVPEGAGQAYACWVEVNGERRRLGRMYWAGELWAWAGPAVGLADLLAGAVFGVSLGPSGTGGSQEPVLTGRL